MPAPTASEAAGADRAFREFLQNDWIEWLAQAPDVATIVGVRGFDDRWPDDSPAGIEARRHHLSESRKALRSVSRDALGPAARLDYDLYDELLATATRGVELGFDALPFRFGMPRYLAAPFHQMEGLHLSAPDTLDAQPRDGLADFEAILERLRRLPTAVDQDVALLREALARGITLPAAAIQGVPGQVTDLVPEDPMASALLAPFTKFPARIAEKDRERLRTAAVETYRTAVAPAFRRLHACYVHEYLPKCRSSVGVDALPNGPEIYRYLVGWQTTTALTPQEVHDVGLAEVKRIRAEMDRIMRATGFSGSFAEFLAFLRTDRRFFFDRADDLIAGYRALAKRIDPQLARLFGRLPRLPYGVVPVPEYRARASPAAYYISGAPTTGRAGYFYANTYEVGVRPKWEMEALALHEAVPGHHLQIAIAQELDGLPEFRRHSGYTAFVEGWGLYAESLGEELDCFADRYSKFGQLTYDMWRSIRLVVDTGMHALGWSRERAIEFFREHAGKSDLDIAVEVDRYIVWPGQALAYKIGQLKHRELRTYAEKELGDAFDVRRFHDMLLGEGALPLGILERRTREWVAAERSRAAT